MASAVIFGDASIDGLPGASPLLAVAAPAGIEAGEFCASNRPPAAAPPPPVPTPIPASPLAAGRIALAGLAARGCGENLGLGGGYSGWCCLLLPGEWD